VLIDYFLLADVDDVGRRGLRVGSADGLGHPEPVPDLASRPLFESGTAQIERTATHGDTGSIVFRKS
jgi:hypothetical protein